MLQEWHILAQTERKHNYKDRINEYANDIWHIVPCTRPINSTDGGRVRLNSHHSEDNVEF